MSGCERLAPPPAHEQPKPAEDSAPTASAPAAEATGAQAHADDSALESAISPGEIPEATDRYPAPARLIAIGDVHGDIQATRKALQLGGAIDAEDHWIGGELVVVQTGDQLDRGDDEQAILELLAKIQREAAAAGGAVHLLNGNHEYMNALGDLRYVTPGGFSDFEDAPGVDPARPELAEVMAQAPKPTHARVAAFWPGQPWAKELAKRNMIVVVGDSVFVHGGVTPAWAGKIESINAESRAWLAGERAEPPAAVVDSDGPVWSRHYSDAPDAGDCAMLEEALEIIGVRRMVVGHTVHTEGVVSACGGQVWMIDVGMAGYYGGPVEVLEVREDSVTVLR
ncbi:serine-threonine protein phosphatase [Enhygromyxa salina]|uniref:Serine-threonine protein phosphatase n=1 Tax=Enhygromyxa salina TaxID=215803 RepID=A0A0C2D6G9_9BACT|nr:shewanella-like protein phosphatase [Enhygromyxa salina]KIG18751.1 serine-threonine protein phosphatase [Enhygromyxa salina]